MPGYHRRSHQGVRSGRHTLAAPVLETQSVRFPYARSMQFTSISCICGGSGPALFSTSDCNFGTTQESVSIRRCDSCGSLYPERFPTSDTLTQAYGGYYTTPSTRRGVRRLVRTPMDASRREYMARSVPAEARSVLDYGCGSGEFLRKLNEQRPEVKLYGTDLLHVPGPFHWVSLEEIGSGETYDWITLSHVIEHLADPTAALAKIRRALAPGGGVWIATPNADSMLIRSFQGHARDVDFPRHRQIFSREALQAMMGKAGFVLTFMSPPRVNAGLNYLSCARNAHSSGRLPKIGELVFHMFAPRARRDAESPEIVVTAKLADSGAD